jgi:predicted deacylase
MFASVVDAQEKILQKESPTVSPTAEISADASTLDAKRSQKKIPTAPNVDLKEVVVEAEEAAPIESASPESTVAPEDNIEVVAEPLSNEALAPERERVTSEEKALIEKADSAEEQAALEEHAAIEEQAALSEREILEQENALDQTAAKLEHEVNATQGNAETQERDEVAAPQEQDTVVSSKFILGMEVPSNTATRLTWTPGNKASGLAERTPVLVVNGKSPGETLCLTGAVHGDELNGIEMIRRIMYQLNPEKLTGTVIGVPVVNLMGFRRNSRYLPDRRDLNRFFPGNTHGSSASRIAHSFFTKIILRCDALVDIHTGSLNRTNLIQLRADLSNDQVVSMSKSFGHIAVLNSRGNPRSLRTAAVRAGIPSVTIEAGEPMRVQREVVAEGTKAIETLMAKMNMIGRSPRKSSRTAPVYYKSSWVRANQSGIFLSDAALGERVAEGEVLGTVTDPITNKRSDILSPYRGRILGMALDQVVLPGFAIYHIGRQTPEALMIEEGQLAEESIRLNDDGSEFRSTEEGVESSVEEEVPTHDALDDDE